MPIVGDYTMNGVVVTISSKYYNHNMKEKLSIIDSNESLVSYIDNVWNSISDLGIDLDGYIADHIGLRINWGPEGEGDYSRYLRAKQYMLSQGAVLISEAIIPMTPEGRPISIFELKDGLVTAGGNVNYIEIPAPRKGKDEKEGTDHIEIVLPKGMSLSDFAQRYRDLLRTRISEESLKASLDKELQGGINPDITLDLEPNLRVKFHTNDIGYVVREEQSGLPILDILAQEFERNTPGVLS